MCDLAKIGALKGVVMYIAIAGHYIMMSYCIDIAIYLFTMDSGVKHGAAFIKS